MTIRQPASRPLTALFALMALVAVVGRPSASAMEDPEGFRATPLRPTSVERAVFGKETPRDRWPTSSGGMTGVIVKLDVEPLASYDGGVPGLAPTAPWVTGSPLRPDGEAARRYLAHVHAVQRDFEQRLHDAIPSARVTTDFDVVLGGVAVLVPALRAAEVGRLEGVVDAYPDVLAQPTTDSSPQFIGAPSLWAELGGPYRAGQHVVVGVLDSGIWPEHASFSEPDPLGRSYPIPPPPLSGTRACEFTGGSNPGPAFACNDKLIGADRFMATYEALVGLLPTEYSSARDDNGHGSHTAGTAAGNRGVEATLFGVSRGTLSGVAPRAHVMAYKVCGNQGCYGSDSVAAIQEAIQDGVHVLNFSISGGADPYADPVELAFLDAYNAGIFVAASAGNSGPGPDTVQHRAPWVTTVGASTTNRHFMTTVSLLAANGDQLALRGASLTAGLAARTRVVAAASSPYDDPFCANGTADGAFTGRVVVCQRGGAVSRVQKGFNVAQRGADAMVLYNLVPEGLSADNPYLPAAHLESDEGARLVAFLGSHGPVKARFPAGSPTTVQGDVMAPFSSRGGAGLTLGAAKPDLVAPGVQVLAATTPTPATAGSGGQPSGQLFQGLNGTSMASPHVAGAAALLKDLRPGWTPGQIKSALMTMANHNVRLEDGSTPATPFDRGSGRVALTGVWDPRATFDAVGADFVTFSDQLYRTNQASLYIPSMPGRMTVQRTLHNLRASTTTWAVTVSEPVDLDVIVPSTLTVPGGGDLTFNITVDARSVPLGAVRNALIRLSNSTGGVRVLRFPVTIVRGQPIISMTHACAPPAFPEGATTTCTITATNPLFEDVDLVVTDDLPSRLDLVGGSATGGLVEDGNGVSFTGTLDGSEPPGVSIGPGPSPGGGYLPLSSFGVPPVGGVTDDSITNFNVPAFTFAGETWTTIGFSSNGYAVLGGGSGPDNSLNNQLFPDTNRPNNVLAPYWTDLNPAAAGALRIATLTDGSDTWIVLDWEAVREYSAAGNLHSLQIWIGIDGDANPVEDVSYAYGANTGNGNGGFLSVGAENRYGTRGQNVYFNGSGTLPVESTQLRVTTTPPSTSSRTFTFQATGVRHGSWVNYVKMTSNAFYGVSFTRFAGSVT